MSAESLTSIINAIKSGDLDNSRGSEVFEHMLANELDVAASMSALGIEKVDDGAIDELRQFVQLQRHAVNPFPPFQALVRERELPRFGVAR